MIQGGSKEHREESKPYALESELAPIKLAERQLSHIRFHPDLARKKLRPTEVDLEPLRERWRMIADLPILVTQDGILLDGHKRFLIASEKGITQLRVLVMTIPEDEVIARILGNAKAKGWLNPFCCFEVALSQTECLEKKAREHQRAGGREKGLMRLSKAHRLNVREIISKMAGGSQGNVRKVAEIEERAIPELIEDLRFRRRSIHSGWKIAQLNPADQKREIAKGAMRRCWSDLRKNLNQVKSRQHGQESMAAECISMLLEILRDSPIWDICGEHAMALLNALGEQDGFLLRKATIQSAQAV